MSKFVYVVFFGFFLLNFLYPIEVFSAEACEALITLRVKQKKIGDLVGRIKEQTGYIVKLDEKAASLSVTGFFNSVSLDDFFKRVFKGKNIFLVRDDRLKIIKVKQVDSSSKEFTAGYGKNQFGMATKMESNNVHSENVFGTNMSIAELDAISVKNAELYKLSTSDPSTLVLGTTLTRAQLDSVGLKNKKIYEAEKANRNSMVPGTSVNKSKIISEAEKNYKIYKTMKSDPNQIVFGTNMTVAELNAITAAHGK